VNISAHQFLQQDMAAVVTRILKESRFDPNLLELEITESAALRNAELTQDILRRLVKMGIRIAIDDFGTGYSSLTYLKQLPIQAVKIDRSFVRDLATDQNDAVIATAIINMAHILDLNVVAEGVETQDQLDFIKAKGCDEFQGYLLAKPMPASGLTTVLKNLNAAGPRVRPRNGAEPAAAGRVR
jgi:EAL domain-containing protein (putative c-di-GMP-specific phosphodiesterase class I)